MNKFTKLAGYGLLASVVAGSVAKKVYLATRKPKLFHLRTIADLTPDQFKYLLNLAVKVKACPKKYRTAFKDKTLLMLFEKPSLRTRVSFETGATQMGGHAIMYDIKNSPLGAKETYSDTAKVLSRYCDVVMARVNKREDIDGLADNATIPIINGLDDWGHPCQMLADFQTILEHRGSLEGIVLAYYGDSQNNVTYGLMRSVAMLGGEIHVVCPPQEKYRPVQDVIDWCEEMNAKTGGVLKITNDPIEGATGANVIYTDSWLSYHINSSEKEERLREFDKYRVTSDIMEAAAEDAIFMHCLPAQRGWEVSEEVIDGNQSVVFDEAENRLHAQKAFIIWLMDRD